MSELKPCPFCGGKPINGYALHVYCPDCFAQLRQEVHENRSAIIARWNRRTPSPAVRALMRACYNIFDRDGNPPFPNTHKAVTLYTDISSALAAVEREIGEASNG